MLRVCEKLREADAKGRRYGLARAETGYLRALVDAMADKDRLAEVELLKSLGDVNLEKGRLGKDVGKFKMALALYMAAVVRCRNKDQGEGIENRYEYTERLLQGVSSKGSQGKEQSTEDKETTSPAKVAEKFQDMDKTRAANGNTDSVLVGYARLMVEGIVKENNMLETEAIKSIGDLYLKGGRKTRNTRDLTKATALYNTALARCNNVHGTVVIVHRLLHIAKIRQDITTTNKKRSTRTQLQQEVTRRKDHVSPISTATSSDAINDGKRGLHIAPEPQKCAAATRTRVDDDNIYKEHLQDGCKNLQTGDLVKAEQHFAAALKSVHTKGEHRKEAEPLYKLSDVYLKRGIQSKDGGDFTKAAALCNAALVRSRREDIEEAIQEITQAFVKEVLKIEQNVNSNDKEKHKSILKVDREYVEKKIKRIEQEVDPYIFDNDDDPKVKEVEMKRAEAIKTLSQTIVDQRKMFITGLVDECMEVMGPPPCKYAMIGLGSQATGLVTPYSDLEFAILVQDETEHNAVYFRNLTHYLHLKVIDLGETILPAMGIKSLNDFYSDDPLDSWFYDSVTPRGFSFDGAMPHACKTPLGRGRNSTGTSELIHTPINMINILTDDLTLHLKKGYHLASILGNVSFITGEQGLVNEYRSLWTQQLGETNETLLVLANTDLSENALTFKAQTLTASLLNVKKEIYRFSGLAISTWALLHNIQPTTIWETIKQLENRGVINIQNAHHLMVLVSISAELRLRTYMNNRGQVENMSALSSISTDAGIGEKLQKVFHISNTRQLMRYYYTERPLKRFVSQLNGNQPLTEPPALFDNSSELKAEVYESLCDFQNFKRCTEQTLNTYLSKHSENTAQSGVAALLNKLGTAWRNLGDHRKAISYYEQSLQMYRSKHGKDAAHSDIAGSLNNLSNAWRDLGDNRKAVSYYEQSLMMYRGIYGEGISHPDIASLLNNLGGAWRDLGDHQKAISYYEQALKMRQIIYREGTAHYYIANSLNSLANALRNLGDYKKAVSYYEQALKMYRVIYGVDTAHHDIASVLNNLGVTWSNLGNHRKAVSYDELSLQMYRSIYGEDTAHPFIAGSLNNLGAAWRELGDHRKAVSYYEQSLQVSMVIYGEETAHSDIASSLNNLGNAWRQLGDHRKAVSYHEQSLQMERIIYGEDTAHPDIASSLNNLGAAWTDLGDNRKAAIYHEQALQMKRSIYGEATEHPDIARSLNNLGNAWSNLGDHRKAIIYYEQSLQMKYNVYGEDTEHPDIASSLSNLGNAWGDLGDYKKAVNYYEHSLQMRQSIYGEDTAHSEIASLLSNLGVAWANLGNHRNAVTYFEQALQMRQKIFGENTHPDIADSLNNLGAACSYIGDHRKAVSYYEQALQMRRSIFGKDTAHPVIADSLNNFGTACSKLGDHRKAVSYYDQALQMRRGIYGEDTVHPDIASSLTNLAIAWRSLGDYRKAKGYFVQAQQMKQIIKTANSTNMPHLL